MSVFDFFLFYLYFLKYIAIFLIIFLFVFGVDDLFIDLMYWKKVLLRINSRKNREKNVKTDIEQSYMAIMIPAWQEDGVVEKMVSLLASSSKYDNFHIQIESFVYW